MEQYNGDKPGVQIPNDLEEDESEEQFYDFDSEDYDGTGGSTPIVSASGLLPRDKQRKTAYYDYASEKSLSHADAKLFYQRHQLEQQVPTEVYSPLKRAWAAPSAAEADVRNFVPNSDQNQDLASGKHYSSVLKQLKRPDELSENHRSERPESKKSQRGNRQVYPPVNDAPDAVVQHELDDSNHMEPAQDAKSTLPLEQGIHGAGACVNIGSGVGEFVTNTAFITSELSTIYTNIQRILDIRHKYIRLSLQEPGDNPKDDPGWIIYPPPPEPVWDEENNRPIISQPGSENLNVSKSPSPNTGDQYEENENCSVHTVTEKPRLVPVSPRRPRKPGQNIGEDFDMSDLLPLPEESEMTFKLDNEGVFQVYETLKSVELEAPILSIPTIRDFYMDLDIILQISSDGPTKSFAFRRLQFLEGKYNLYFLLNEYQEMADSKRVPHRDFYNVRKVDTHVHHSACMNQKHLLRFIKSKMKKSPDEVVMYRDHKHLTLREVFESINLTAYDLSIDTLDMHVRGSVHPLQKRRLVNC